jgi:hypothetical protein
MTSAAHLPSSLSHRFDSVADLGAAGLPSAPTPRIVPLAAVVIGGIVVVYLSDRFRKR